MYDCQSRNAGPRRKYVFASFLRQKIKFIHKIRIVKLVKEKNKKLDATRNGFNNCSPEQKQLEEEADLLTIKCFNNLSACLLNSGVERAQKDYFRVVEYCDKVGEHSLVTRFEEFNIYRVKINWNSELKISYVHTFLCLEFYVNSSWKHENKIASCDPSARCPIYATSNLDDGFLTLTVP
jgi:hypothetical protein